MLKFFRKLSLLWFALSACPAVQGAQPDTVRIVFIGDVMSHGPQLTAALRRGGDRSNPADFDYSACFRHVRDRFDRADFVVANMEFPVGVVPYSGYPLFSAPQSLAREARRSGIGLFLAANNHICDKGRAGLDSTYAVYSRLDVPFTGFYRSEGEEFENNPLIINIKGIDVAFINFTYGTNGMPDVSANQMYYAARESGPITTMPEIPGLAVWSDGHIGVYIGGGQVIEAMGTKYGVVKTQLAGRRWTHWLKIPYITYD